MSQANKDLVLRYFNSWQAKDFEEMRRCLADRLQFDGGIQHFNDADEFTDFCRALPPWNNVEVIDLVINGNKAALLYEGINENNMKIRVGEFIQISLEKISHIHCVFMTLI